MGDLRVIFISAYLAGVVISVGVLGYLRESWRNHGEIDTTEASCVLLWPVLVIALAFYYVGRLPYTTGAWIYRATAKADRAEGEK